MSTNIHPTAIVDPKAKFGENVKIGPYAIIEADVEIGDNGIVGPHAIIYNGARIGKNVKIYQAAAVSNIPQDLKYDNEETHFYVGDNCTIREYATLHKGTAETGFSRVGDNCLMMAYSHVAHDCVMGNNCIISNSVQIGGHSELEDWVILGGGVLVHQFSKVGQHSMVGGGSKIRLDIPPYAVAGGDPTRYAGINSIGLRRRGFTNEQIAEIKDAYALIFTSKDNFANAKKKLAEKSIKSEYAKIILDFIEASSRGIVKR